MSACPTSVGFFCFPSAKASLDKKYWTASASDLTVVGSVKLTSKKTRICPDPSCFYGGEIEVTIDQSGTSFTETACLRKMNLMMINSHNIQPFSVEFDVGNHLGQYKATISGSKYYWSAGEVPSPNLCDRTLSVIARSDRQKINRGKPAQLDFVISNPTSQELRKVLLRLTVERVTQQNEKVLESSVRVISLKRNEQRRPIQFTIRGPEVRAGTKLVAVLKAQTKVSRGNILQGSARVTLLVRGHHY
ncbi:MAG: hypothetical protein QOE70_4693 [Chthoniobacter sp.]|nr:hypothetical protein [Chthoniobacter sp.]